MKKEPYDTREKEELKKYYLKGFRSLKKEVEYYRNKKKHQPYYLNKADYLFSHEPVTSLDISQKNITELLMQAQEISRVQIDYETLYVQNISQFDEVYQSMIHRIGLAPIKTKETTLEIMNRYFKQQGVSYEMVQHLGKMLGITKFCPYLVGDSCFIPDFGKSHPLTSWLALHQVVDSEQIKGSKETYLFCRNNYRVILPISLKRFTKRIEHAASIYHIQRSIMHFMNRFFAKEVTVHIEEPFNIIHQFLIQMQFVLPRYTLIEIISYLKYFWVSEAIKKEFGIEDPYLSQLRSHFESSNIMSETERHGKNRGIK
ncbi:competence protein ComK [Carnobacterium gallinarum]|uniref:competence protein ComK n=1 Tax=Carnobacterium gallinarum TaxID=2749 RepID=UPI00055694D6|nr:competence protein ComK [Carnobacterium gallinarum]